MTLAVTMLIIAATFGLAALLSSPLADKHPTGEAVMFIAMYSALVSLVVGAIMSVLSGMLGVQ
jgi:hypothetical protein